MPTIKERMAELVILSGKKLDEINARPKQYAGYDTSYYYGKNGAYLPSNLPGVDKPVLMVGDACQIKAYASTGFEKGCGMKVNNKITIITSFKNDKWMAECAFIDRDRFFRDNIYTFLPCNECAKGPCKSLSLYTSDLQFIKKTQYKGEKV